MSQISEEAAPEFLYKYYPFLEGQRQSYAQRLFVHGEIYFSSPLEFNDPFDCRAYRYFALPVLHNSMPQWILTDLHKTIPQIPEEQRQQLQYEKLNLDKINGPLIGSLDDDKISELINDFRIFCLSANRENILMWSHYSSGHKGFCLEFRQISESVLGPAYKVAYPSDNKYPLITFFEKEEAKERVTKMFLSKTNLWEYEQEWRIIDVNEDDGIRHLPQGVLSGIIFGFKMPDQDKKQIIEWIKEGEFEPKLYQAKKKEEEFGLDIISL